MAGSVIAHPGVSAPEERLVAALEALGHPDLPDLRRSLAVGAYVEGRITLADASRLARAPESAFAVYRPASVPLSGAIFPNERPLLSVVIPVYNEERGLPELYRRLTPILAGIGAYEIVFVNDGSRDGSAEAILRLRSGDPSVCLVDLSRNFGHQAALSAGLDHARGAAVVLMDADLQDPPELLSRFVAEWRAGSDVVYAVRRTRQESIPKQLAYRVFYRLLARMANIRIPLDAGDFCLMDRRVVDHLRALPERNRFLRGLRSWVGFRQVGVEYDRPARFSGETKYSLGALIRLALDGLVSFTTAPLRAAVYVGFLTALSGVAYLLYALAVRFAGHVPPGWTSLAVLVLLLGGMQLALLGILGEYVGRIYEEAKQRPNYVVQRLYGPDTLP